MASFTALIHARTGDEHRLGRLLETLRPCDEILIVDVDESHAVTEMARQYGANVKQGIPGVASGAYVMDAKHDWVLALLPSESLSEELEASLFEWKREEHEPGMTFAVAIRQETQSGWQVHEAETRLVNRTAVNWIGELPENETDSCVLEGDLLRFQN